ncbi:SigE family RNA polymerase sigma factor [Fodinicola feengrottensis]|uniref:SigE family RNA polymerase sigma factor n=1 Tax=Fodinicola feengrottensis TaxID=435914 RepID=UPI0031D1F93D
MRGAEREAYVEYVSRCSPRLRRIATLLAGDPARGDDLVQETLTKLFVQWKRASGADNIDRYVQRMLYRVFIDDRRRKWASVRLFDTMPESAYTASDPADAMAVRTALRQVPKGQRAVLVLRFFGDLSVNETAEVLGCSVGNVKSQTARGLEALKGALNPPEAPLASSSGASR